MHGVPAHRIHKAGKLRRLLAARGQHGEQRGNFHLRHAAGENLLEDFGRLLPGQRGASSASGLRNSFSWLIAISMVIA